MVEDRWQQAINIQRRNLALEYDLTSIDSICNALARKVRSTAKAWRILKAIFLDVSEAAINANLSKFQTVEKKGERVVSHSI